ncbi:hypothetical protein PUN28_001986 [Cardiocondyla obscurior]|uniref:Uncharacterized protein n=1 Tax=Cardiocondyla obscurior TaxID=286306 RepID=A0AAW2GS04_9HYME
MSTAPQTSLFVPLGACEGCAWVKRNASIGMLVSRAGGRRVEREQTRMINCCNESLCGDSRVMKKRPKMNIAGNTRIPEIYGAVLSSSLSGI